MANRYVHPATNRALRQSQEDKLVSKSKVRKKVRKYWVVNRVTNKRSSGPVTMEKFLDDIGRNYAVAKQYELVPA